MNNLSQYHEQLQYTQQQYNLLNQQMNAVKNISDDTMDKFLKLQEEYTQTIEKMNKQNVNQRNFNEIYNK